MTFVLPNEAGRRRPTFPGRTIAAAITSLLFAATVGIAQLNFILASDARGLLPPVFIVALQFAVALAAAIVCSAITIAADVLLIWRVSRRLIIRAVINCVISFGLMLGALILLYSVEGMQVGVISAAGYFGVLTGVVYFIGVRLALRRE